MTGGTTINIFGREFLHRRDRRLLRQHRCAFDAFSHDRSPGRHDHQSVCPAGTAGTADLTVAGPGGFSTQSSLDQFTYYNSPTFNPGPTPVGPVAGGVPLTITGAGLANVTAVHFEAPIWRDDHQQFVQSSDQCFASGVDGQFMPGTVNLTITTTLCNDNADFIHLSGAADRYFVDQ